MRRRAFQSWKVQAVPGRVVPDADCGRWSERKGDTGTRGAVAAEQLQMGGYDISLKTKTAVNTERGAKVLATLDADWMGFRESYAGLPDAALMEPGVTELWSVRDLIAHVTWWEEEALRHLPLILDGGRPPRYSVT